MSNHRKTLAWRASENHVNSITWTEPGGIPNVLCREADNATRDHSAVGEIIFVNGAMDRVDLNSSANIKASLFEPQAHTACAGEQIDSDWSSHTIPLPRLNGDSRCPFGRRSEELHHPLHGPSHFLGFALPDGQTLPARPF
jgi:hypothetical protein